MRSIKRTIAPIVLLESSWLLLISLLVSGCSGELSQNSNNSTRASDSFINTGEKIIFPDASNKTLSPLEYRNWILHNCIKEKESNDIYYKLLYKPHDYIVCVENESLNITSSERNKINNELGLMEYFELRIGSNSSNGDILKLRSNNDQEYETRVKYFAFKFQKDIGLITSVGDTIRPALFHFERAYDVTPYCTFSLGFPSDKIDYDKPFAITIKDSVFNSGVIRFVIPAKQFSQLPKLKTI